MITQGDIQRARKAKLAQFMEQNYPFDVISNGTTSICLKSNLSLSIDRRCGGYHDFATNEHGNSLEFLMRYLRYDFANAVEALLPFSSNDTILSSAKSWRFQLPESADPPFNSVFKYLEGRAIPGAYVELLVSRKLLYQDKSYSNAVFVTPERDYCEIRGTLPGSKFHGCRKLRPKRFWYFQPDCNEPAEVAYICEAAIDAVSLFLLCAKNHWNTNAVYISIGGVSNQLTIERIKSKFRSTIILAVDNDDAGAKCRERNRELSSLIPITKDWNQDLMLT